jgi:hypothetical protein
MILTAYVDESGTHGGSRLTVMAGYLSTAERWTAFQLEWASFLAELGVDHLHAKHLFHGQKPFKGLSWEERAEIADRALALARQHTMFGICVVLTNEDFDNIFRAGEATDSILDSKYGICFRHLLSYMLQLITLIDDKPNKLSIFVESGHKNQGAARTIASDYKGIGHRERARMLKEVGYVDKRDCVGVQAADILAFSLLRFELNGLARVSDIDITRDTIETREVPRVFRFPVTEQTLTEVKKGVESLAKFKRRFGQKGVDMMSAAREAINIYLESHGPR